MAEGEVSFPVAQGEDLVTLITSYENGAYFLVRGVRIAIETASHIAGTRPERRLREAVFHSCAKAAHVFSTLAAAHLLF